MRSIPLCLAACVLLPACHSHPSDHNVAEASHRKVNVAQPVAEITDGARSLLLAPCSPTKGCEAGDGDILRCSEIRRLLDRDPQIKDVCGNRYAIDGALAVLAKTPSLDEISRTALCTKGRASRSVCRETKEFVNQANCDDVAQVGFFANRKNPRWPEVVGRIKEVCGLDPLPPETGK